MEIVKINPNEAKLLIENYHYSKRLPSATKYVFGCYENSYLTAAIFFGNPVGRNLPKECLELTRLVRNDDFSYTLSQFVSKSLKWLKKNTQLPFVISYADKTFDHHGGIYQATNFDYVFSSGSRLDGFLDENNNFIHARTCNARLGTSSLKKVLEIKPNWKPHYSKGKYLYAYKLDKKLKWEDYGWKVMDYPKPNKDINMKQIKNLKKEIRKSIVAGSPPDIDLDFEAENRETIKQYFIDKYGYDQTAYIGTVNVFKIKSGIKELAREDGINFGKTNYVTGTLPEKQQDELKNITELFRYASETPVLKDFIQENYELFNQLPLSLDAIKTQSIHAAGLIIFPQKDNNGNSKTVYDWVPVRSEDGKLVTEYGGAELEELGFLKEDILGIDQADKLKNMIYLIEENYGEKINLDDIPLNDKTTFKLFQQGFTQDVFQFNSSGMIGFLKDLKPENIEHLIAANALYRPGAMASDFHKKYAKIKNGKLDPAYIEGTEEILKDTHSLIIYQEQIIRIVQELAGFSLSESDSLRKAVGKKDSELMQSYKDKFIKGVAKNINQKVGERLWEIIEASSNYSFNRCISGDERMYRMGSNFLYRPTIGEMYKIMNDSKYAKRNKKGSLRSKYLRNGYGICWSLNNDGKIRKNKIKDIRFEGFQDIYRVTLKNKKTIDVTLEHKFPTNNGEKRLRDIDIYKDKIYFNLGYKQDKWGKEYSIIRDKGYEVYGDNIQNWYAFTNYPLNSEKGKRGFQKRETEYTAFYRIRDKKRSNNYYCELCNRNFKENNLRRELHHLDEDTGNNTEENLVLICASCHKKEHYKNGRTKMGEKGLESILIEIDNISFLKNDEVYDVEVEGPNHNFTLDNGIVTSNSHSAAYAIIAYYTQYLKAHYPLEFWTTAFKFVKSDKNNTLIHSFINEIERTGEVAVKPPDINKSEGTFTYSIENKEIYWSLPLIKNVGEVAVQNIIDERNENGKFYSIEEFLERINKSKVNKRVIENLIIAGTFDQVEKIEKPQFRYDLLKKYYDLVGIKEGKEFDFNYIDQEHYWILQQRELTGLGQLNLEAIYNQSGLTKEYLPVEEFFDEKNVDKEFGISGLLTKFVERNTKRGVMVQLELDCNMYKIYCTIWNDAYAPHKKLIKDSENKIISLTGMVKYDSWKKQNVLMSNEGTKIVKL